MTCNTPPYLYRRDKRRKLVHSFNHKEYRIAPNFQGIKFSRIGDWQIFADLNFADQRFQLPRPFPATAHARFISHTQVIGTCQEWAEQKSLERIRLEMATTTTDTETFSVEAMVRGYHVYQEICDTALGEQLSCKRESGNHKDPFAVAVVKALVTIGHLPKKISSVCSMFLLRSGTIHCQVTAPRRYSRDLPQGGLEIPCMLTFEGDRTRRDIVKARRLVRYGYTMRTGVLGASEHG